MRRFVGAALLLFVITSVGSSGDAPDARAIIARAIQALGGEAKLEKNPAATWKEKGTYYGMGQGLPYTGTYAAHWPSRFRMDVEGVFTIVVDGDKGWTKSGGGVKDLSREEMALQLHNHRAGWITQLTSLKDKAFKVTRLPDEKVDGEPVHVVQVTRPGYPEVKLSFSNKSALLVKTEYRTQAPEQKNQEVTQTTFFSDYRDVQGVKMAHKVVMKRDGKLFVEADLSDIRLLDKVDPRVFAKPAD